MADLEDEDILTEEAPEDEGPVDFAALEPDYLGPTWLRGEDGKFVLPARTLGWDVIGWVSHYIAHPKIPGQRWRFTKEQARFVLWWYAIDERGMWIYRRGVLQRMKGWGKDPLLAVISLVELLGPCRFGGWNEDGSPIAVDEPNAWVQVSAVAKEQTKNTMKMFPSLITDELKADYKLEVLKEHIHAMGGRKVLEAVTSNFRTLEGGRSTFVLMNETHHWISGNGGHEMYETIAGNTTKSFKGAARFLAITNAYLPGEDSVAERMRLAYEDILEGRAPDMGFLYDSIEAHPKSNLTYESLEAVLPKIRGDADWLSVESIIADIIGNTSIGPARQRRMWLNQIVADQDALYDVRTQWDIPEITSEENLVPGDKIALGFDGGRSDDSTALVAVRVKDGFVQLLHLQERPRGDEGEGWIVDYARANSAVHAAFRDYKVVGFFADVKMWESYVADWGADYGDGLEVKAPGANPVAWDMRGAMKRVTLAHEQLMDSIFNKKLRHGTLSTKNPWREMNLQLRRHMQNARRRENAIGVSFGKESRESPKKVDAYAALLLAHTAYTEYRLKHDKGKAKTGRRWFI